MKLLTAIPAAALLALTVPAFAQTNPATSGPATNSAQPSGAPGATGGTDPKEGGAAGMTEGRSSVTDPSTGAMKNGYKSPNGATNNNMAPGGGPGDAGGASK